MKNLKRFIGYLAYVVAIGFAIIKLIELGEHLKNLSKYNFDYSMVWTYMSLFPIAVGILLSIPHLARTIRKPGILTYDGIKFITIGLPTFLIAIIPLSMQIHWEPLQKIVYFYMVNNTLITISGIVFGYVLVTSFDKEV